MKTAPVIAIDGPSGSGKGTIASRVAEHLGFSLLDSGALYRVLGIACHQHNIDLSDPQAVASIARGIDIQFGLSGEGSVWLDGGDVSLAIRTDLGSDLASKVGAIEQARQALFQRQLDFRIAPGLVADGRDMGTTVFPDATLKIYLTASLESRAQRRYKQLIGKGIGATLLCLLRDLKERDRRDSERTVSPLKPAEDAIVIDTTELTIDQVVNQVLEHYPLA